MTLARSLTALLLLSSPATAQPVAATMPSRISFDMLIAGQEQVSWTLNADGTGEAVLRNVPGDEGARGERRIALHASDGEFRWAVDHLSRYRALAQAAPGCAITAEGVMAFRLTWREGGQSHVASFSDNCGGIPTDFFDVMRPLGERMEGWQQSDTPPPAP